MYEIIKDFIENNISYIETENWEYLFMEYYENYSNLVDTYMDARQLTDLFNVFEECGIPLEDASREARFRVIENAMAGYIDGTFKNNTDIESISMTKCVNQLYSRLNLRLAELRQCFEHAADSLPEYERRTLTVYRGH